MAEKELQIDIPNSGGLKIRTILRGSLDKPVVILVHGRPGSGNDLLEYLGARYLSDKGFTTLRVFLYDFGKNARNLVDCTVQTHADDFDVIVAYLRENNVPKIFATGHSYGGPTILKSKSQLDAAVLWDPAHGLSFIRLAKKAEDDGTFPETVVEVRGQSINVGTGGYGYIEPKAMLDDEASWGDNSEWASKDYPLKIISAGKGILKEGAVKYLEAANSPKEHVTIDEAGHLFEESDKVTEQLFSETLSWLERFSHAR
jgi:pimeloyl-ACP methyl ester carboxylesterase